MPHIQISIHAAEEEQEILISELTELGSTGFEQTSTHLLAYFEEDDFQSYDVQKVIEGRIFEISVIADQNWNKVWESNFDPVVIDRFCAIRADFHEPVAGVTHEIIITPKMSFGTGHHATTFMMIQQMERLYFNNKKVFDFGTGTGILSILAEKLGAGSISAIDVDDWSIKNAKENFEKNKCNRISITHTSILPQARFDVVLANINRNVILQNLKPLCQIVETNGQLLISGLMIGDEEVIVKAFLENGLKCVHKLEKQQWLSLLFSE